MPETSTYGGYAIFYLAKQEAGNRMSNIEVLVLPVWLYPVAVSLFSPWQSGWTICRSGRPSGR